MSRAGRNEQNSQYRMLRRQRLHGTTRPSLGAPSAAQQCRWLRVPGSHRACARCHVVHVIVVVISDIIPAGIRTVRAPVRIVLETKLLRSARGRPVAEEAEGKISGRDPNG